MRNIWAISKKRTRNHKITKWIYKELKIILKNIKGKLKPRKQPLKKGTGIKSQNYSLIVRFFILIASSLIFIGFVFDTFLLQQIDDSSEKNYLQLESPHLLLLSFRVTVAVTLLYLLEIRQQWQRSPELVFDTSDLEWQRDWNRLLMKSISLFDEKSVPQNSLTKVLWQDLVIPSYSNLLRSNLSKSGTQNLKRGYAINEKSYYPWQKPIFFSNYNKFPKFSQKFHTWNCFFIMFFAKSATSTERCILKLKMYKVGKIEEAILIIKKRKIM